ncbi:PIN domain-containing protein [Neorhizobium galegae]|uniref:PIN domain-containing protein n=1 Tax=Neorhizobium galegae TaxID=399 RepID=UPI002104F660|nr:PIN domain-containing protein [Neorhizobium galegae]MCQ1779432.1 PIN domain-containing protein [Neorhizobium galegae]MCQ1795592.1 PIN domain-containing protein [Neorhizobium galegae]
MSITYMLDSSVLSEVTKPRPNPLVIKFLENERYIIPAGTLMEIAFGISRVGETDPAKAARLGDWYDEIVSSAVPLAETNARTARVWGQLASDSRLKNLRVQGANDRKERGLQDLHIAAAAIARNAVVATMDVNDFMQIHRLYPLPGIYDPGAARWHAGDPVRAYLKASMEENSKVKRPMAEFLREDMANDDVEVPEKVTSKW